MKTGYTYILTNRQNRVLYVGVTNSIKRRVWEHRERMTPGFTRRYNCDKLVYFELFPEMSLAIAREKKLKNMGRDQKEVLITGRNPEWRDLYWEI